MKRIFKSRLPAPLTSTQLNSLTRESHLPEQDIQEWYERFNHCYPNGYLLQKEFLTYLQRFHMYNRTSNRPTKSMVKQLFSTLDLNKDKQLNFEEFFLFNVLINQGTREDKLKLILKLYDRDKTKYLTREQLENVLNNMFDLLHISKPTNGLAEKINTILLRANFNDQNTKISWEAFSSAVLNDRALFRLLIAKETDRETSDNDDDEESVIITRF